MAIDVKTLATLNLVVQILLVIMVSGAVYLAKKRELGRHCAFMRALVPTQIIAIATVMLPSMLGFLKNPPPFSTEMNLSFGKSWMPRNLALFMKSA